MVGHGVIIADADGARAGRAPRDHAVVLGFWGRASRSLPACSLSNCMRMWAASGAVLASAIARLLITRLTPCRSWQTLKLISTQPKFHTHGRQIRADRSENSMEFQGRVDDDSSQLLECERFTSP